MNKLRDKCYDSHQLQLLINDQLDKQAEAELLNHMDSCAACQEALESLAADTQLWQELPANLSDQIRIDRGQLEETTEHSSSDLDANIRELLRNMGPTDDPNMLGRIGTYEICGVVGRGSTGIVLKSFEASLNRYVAIKVLLPTLSGNGAARRRFDREARAIAAVVNEHVVPIFAVDEHRGLPYFVMQYVSGASLQNRVERQGPLDACEVVRISMQIANGLAAAHAQGIVHRDIKPANILLEHGLDRVLVSDFGLARVTDGATVTMSGLITGTPSYMAPEQARGDQIDQRSDLFSLGSVMYTMCTASTPFPSETVYGVIRRICETDQRSIRESNPEIPEWLEAFINKLLSKEKIERFESAEQVSAILSHELAHMQNPTLVQVPPREWIQVKERNTAKQADSRRSSWTNSLSAIVGLIAIAAAAILSNGTADDPSPSVAAPESPDGASPMPLQVVQENAHPIAAPSRATVTYLDEKALAKVRLAAKTEPDWAPAPPSVYKLTDGKEYANAIAMAYPVDDIKIDGDGSDWPDELKSYAIERAEAGDHPSSADDLSASFKVGYSSAEQALYVLVEVSDESLILDADVGQYRWDAQDGCELYVDRQHRIEQSLLAQYTRYGDSLNAFGSNEGVKGVGLIVGQQKAKGSSAGKRIYEWRIDLKDGVVANKSMGFDLAVLDKDQDGSFTWLTWGSGTQKIYSPGHHGTLLLVKKDQPLGEVRGNVDWPKSSTHAHHKVRLQSIDFPELWTTIDCPESGNYRAILPAGSYSVSVADDADHDFELEKATEVSIKADETNEVDHLEVILLKHEKAVITWDGSGMPEMRSDAGVLIASEESDSRNDSIAYAYPVADITVDGDLSDWPVEMITYPIVDGRAGATIDDDADLRATYRVGYHVGEQALYVAIQVDDDSFVLNPQASRDWSAQDGAEIYLDTEHRKRLSNIRQINFYGDALQDRDDNIEVATAAHAKGRTFEWRIQSEDVISAGRSLGFDVAVLDKDDDSSFTWLAWGRGTQKAWHGQRCGNLLLVDPETEFGEASGSVVWGDATGNRFPRICFQSLDQPGLRPRIAPNQEGRFTLRLPVGEYMVGPVKKGAKQVRVKIEADTMATVQDLELRTGGN